MAELGELLQELRQDKGLTQKKVAQDLHIGESTVGGYETGVSEPSYPILKSLADYYNVSTDYLLGITRLRSSWKEIEAGLHCDHIHNIPVREFLDIVLNLSKRNQEILCELLSAMQIKERWDERKSVK